MIEPTLARQFAEDWVAAWNRRDLEAILSHYTDDIILQSPLALERLGLPEGRVSGKAAVRAYFQHGLDMTPNLHFELIDVLIGVDGVTILYSRETNTLVGDVTVLNDQYQVIEYRAYYGPVPTKE